MDRVRCQKSLPLSVGLLSLEKLQFKFLTSLLKRLNSFEMSFRRFGSIKFTPASTK